ncbi:F-BAR and double SH3 domains protein 2-like [Montipora capricornis]|uniref:F-BAR and double SH3 domains protein 2-like n=1 Tax=Montipora capricornis TaxID=246305 RepID=UPI0035F1E778
MTTQNQPQKKIKILQLLRAIQAEQLSKLQQKYQQEQELLEDVRNYTKQRSTIEREYSQALQKLNAYFLPKKEFSTDDSTGENGNRTPQDVWKSVLEEAEKKAKKHLAISEELQGQMAESMKTLKLNKTQAFKKCEELTKKIHEEVFETVRELSKAKKGYEDLEKLAQAAREQAADAEDKLKKKNVKFFQSKTSLEKNAMKSSDRLEICERRTATARNEYFLSLAAANAHMTRYFCKELQEIMTSLDGDFFDKMRGYFTTLGQLEVDASRNAMAGFESVVSQANSICRDISLQLFLSKNKVFSEVVQYDFEPCRNDKVRKVTTEHSAGLSLNKEARKLAMKLTKDQMTIKTKSKQLQSVKTNRHLQSPQPGDAGNQESEQNPEALKESIRLAETNKLKTEACLEVLREAGVNVDEWLKSANSLSPNDMEADTLSQYSLNDGCADDDWDDLDDTFTADYSSDDDARSVLSNSSMPVACVALYNYDATNADELTITEGEELEILEKDGDGWCRGRNKSGQIGYFPESYVETESTAIQPSSAASPKNSCTDGPFSGSSVNSQNINKTPATEFLCYVRALYDYEAMGDDEISFKEGDIVGVLSKDENDIDDGFWYGEFQGCRGVFPSLVVEDIPEGYHARDTNMNVTESLTPPASSYFNTRDDYVTLPLDYTANGGSAAPAAAASNALQPVRKAPPPPASSPQIPRSTTMSTGGTRALLPQNRQRARTENTSTMTKPDAAGFARSISQNAALQAKMYENIDQLAPSSRPPDYVNVTNLPTSRVNGGPSTSQSVSSSFPKPAARSRRPAPPPKPAPPTSSSRRTFRSLSYV